MQQKRPLGLQCVVLVSVCVSERISMTHVDMAKIEVFPSPKNRRPSNASPGHKLAGEKHSLHSPSRCSVLIHCMKAEIRGGGEGTSWDDPPTSCSETIARRAERFQQFTISNTRSSYPLAAQHQRTSITAWLPSCYVIIDEKKPDRISNSEKNRQRS